MSRAPAVPDAREGPLRGPPPDLAPLGVVPVLVLLAYPLIGSTSSWLTLTVAGLAMGLIIFIAASGLTLIFGLMDVLNFGHGVFICVGGFIAASVLAPLGRFTSADRFLLNFLPLLAAMVAAMAVAAVIGVAFERLLVRPVYGQHLKQILVTMGGLIIGQELIKMIWGPDARAIDLPLSLRGAFVFGDVGIEKFRVFAVALGLLVYAVLLLTLKRTKVGLLVRAGVENREMVESLGYRIQRLFVGVFVVGASLGGLGGALWGLYQQSVNAQMGAQLNILIFIVIIIGGLGSTTGSFIGALLVGLLANYIGFLLPRLALFSTIALMMGILLWRPQGLYPVAKR